MTALIWGRSSRETLTRHAAAGAIVAVPVGAVEQHGPHLPTGTDARVAEAITRRAADLVGDAVTAIVAPTMPYGSSEHHLGFGGTLSLQWHTMAGVLHDLIRSVWRSGFSRVLLVNGHGGNTDICAAVVKQASIDFDVLAACVSYWRLLDTQAQDGFVPGHAGDFETSIMLSLAGEDVDMAVARPSPGSWPARRQPGVVAADMRSWIAIDGHTGDPTEASAQRGEIHLDQASQAVAAAIRDLASQDRGQRG